MRVLVTGCTGFVGFHTALAFHRAGHQVRLGVRSPDKMRRVFAGFDIPLDDYSTGEIIDAGAVAQALDGVNGMWVSALATSAQLSYSSQALRSSPI